MTSPTAQDESTTSAPGRPLAPLSVTAEERQRLIELTQGWNPRLSRRAAIILACLDGGSNRAVAARFRVSKQAVGKWRARFQEVRLLGLMDQPRSGAPRRIKPQEVARVIGMTLQAPPAGVPRWTTRSMAHACGLSQTTVNRIWRLHGLAPHRTEAPPPANPAPVSASAGPAAVEPPAETGSELIVELRRDLTGLAQMLNATNPAALRVAVDAVEEAFMAAAGSTDVERKYGSVLAPEIRARNEARWRRARALLAEAKATLSAAPPEAEPLPLPPAPPHSGLQPRR